MFMLNIYENEIVENYCFGYIGSVDLFFLIVIITCLVVFECIISIMKRERVKYFPCGNFEGNNKSFCHFEMTPPKVR